MDGLKQEGREAGHEDQVIRLPQMRDDPDELGRGFSLPEDDFRQPSAEAPMRVEAGEPQIVDREPPGSVEPRAWRLTTLPRYEAIR